MTPDEFRRAALDLAGVTESSHMGHPDFRVGGKIFATLGSPTPEYGVVKVTPFDQEHLVKAYPGVFAPAKGAWGRQGYTTVLLAAAESDVVRDALSDAWRLLAPKGVRKP